MRKKRRTPKQVAATRKMIRANRKAKRSSKRRRRNPIAASGASESKRRGKRSKKRSSKRSSKRRSPKRSTAARKAARTRARNKAKRRAAGRKAARTRKRKAPHRRYSSNSNVTKSEKSDYDKGGYGYERRKRRRRAKRRNPIVAVAGERKRRRRRKARRNPIARVAAAPRRRRRAKRRSSRRRRKNPISVAAERPRRRRKAKRRGHKRNSYRRRGTKKRAYHHVKGSSYKRGGRTIRVRRHMRNPLISGNHIANPIEGPMQFLAGFIGVGTGYALASLADRLVTTHALNGAGQDAPAQGEIYNSEALAAPLWGNIKQVGWKRIVANVVAVIVPLGAASAVRKHLGLKTFFQLAAAGAFAKGAGKVMDDGIAHLMTAQPLGQRLYASEIAATGKLNASSLAALPAAPPATFAGLPQGFSRNGITTVHPRSFSPIPQNAPQGPVTRNVAGAPEQAIPDMPFNPMVFNPDGNT